MPINRFLPIILGVMLCGTAITLVYTNHSSSKSSNRLIEQNNSSVARRHSIHSAEISKSGLPLRTDRSKAVASNKTASHKAKNSDLPAAPIMELSIPPGASPTMVAFMTERNQLMNSEMLLQRELANVSLEERDRAMQNWREENAAALTKQQELAQQLGEESAAQPRPPFPQEPNIPPGASPELSEFMTQRHALMMEQSDLEESLRSSGPLDREAAVEAWRADNVDRFAALEQATAQLTKSSQDSPPQ
jgi:hypothetical protein